MRESEQSPVKAVSQFIKAFEFCGCKTHWFSKGHAMGASLSGAGLISQGV